MAFYAKYGEYRTQDNCGPARIEWSTEALYNGRMTLTAKWGSNPSDECRYMIGKGQTVGEAKLEVMRYLKTAHPWMELVDGEREFHPFKTKAEYEEWAEKDQEPDNVPA